MLNFKKLIRLVSGYALCKDVKDCYAHLTGWYTSQDSFYAMTCRIHYHGSSRVLRTERHSDILIRKLRYVTSENSCLIKVNSGYLRVCNDPLKWASFPRGEMSLFIDQFCHSAQKSKKASIIKFWYVQILISSSRLIC